MLEKKIKWKKKIILRWIITKKKKNQILIRRLSKKKRIKKTMHLTIRIGQIVEDENILKNCNQ